MQRLCEEDLASVLMNTRTIWPAISNKTILLTGGTGFFGKWLTQSFIYINDKLQLNSQLIILSRDPEAFLNKFPFCNDHDCLKFIKGDVSIFEFPKEKIDYIIHAATDASVLLNLSEPLTMFDTIVNGTRRMLELAREKNVSSFLFTSSGAVYGEQPEDVSHVEETFIGSPDIYGSSAAYGEGKRVAEMLCNFYNKQYQVNAKIARCFAFLGPYLPLDTHFAIGNFIKNALDNQPMVIKGDGTPYRSYLYASDLTIWLWTILFNGRSGVPYNVGSDQDITIRDLARKVTQVVQKELSIEIMKQPKGGRILRYVPNVDRAKEELNLQIKIGLDEAILKTYNFHKII